ncbi:MAG: hypothetical protein OIF58_00155 [Cohaesibacter sp.]|nr:hypothetical protein [Cohaesibacter sp.]MCV6600107.1 hypothetical protein [Cohaesibacter sp.]
MTTSVDLALARLYESIRAARRSNPVFSPGSLSGRVAVSHNITKLMETISQAYATAMVEIAAECVTLTGNGDLSEAATFCDLVKDDASEHLIAAIHMQAQEMEADLPSYDVNAEHRLTARDYGLNARAFL